MSDRTSRRLTWTRARALLSVGILLGIGSVGTLAAFSASATVKPGSFTTGTLDISFGAPATAIPLYGLNPGESVSDSFAVTNSGNIPLTYKATATVSGALGPALLVTTYLNGTATNSGSQSSGNRSGTCSGTVSGTKNVTLSSTPTTVIGIAQQVAGGSYQSVCVVVSLPSTADGKYQNTSATAAITLNAQQLGGP